MASSSRVVPGSFGCVVKHCSKVSSTIRYDSYRLRSWSGPIILIDSMDLSMSIRPLITRENLYFDRLIRHSFFCSALLRICLVSSPTLIGTVAAVGLY
ncbi:hypothetical protein BpHYR1_050687 [Brachionus plicatilis]|uniref:Uncharacterized protein n=1 Tax=Brachionus plicatilis TaxID=10195 RepID=A0A3M7RBZ5_BRAPC|nr:hypothetical protein BpHYR1_050687 [Brachionus plicatilis]